MRISNNAIVGFLFVFFASSIWVLLNFAIPHSGDGWGYATDVLNGKLTSPHHLLYNHWCKILFLINLIVQIDLISLFTINNLIFGLFSLLLIYHWLIIRGNTKEKALAYTCLLAFTFGFMRFEFENEVYIMPLFFALFGSLYYEKWQLAIKSFSVQSTTHLQLVLAFTLFALSVLFHQSYIFWFIAYAIHAALHRKLFIPSLLTIVIVIVYYIFAQSENQAFFQFITHDAQEGLVTLGIGYKHFLFTLVNATRTLIQIHGNMVGLFQSYPLLAFIGGIGTIGFAVLIVQLLLNNRKILKSTNPINSIFKKPYNPIFIALFLQFSFAFFSMGNAEFMVMLPFLGIALIGKRLKISRNQILWIATCLFLHNTIFGLSNTLYIHKITQSAKLCEAFGKLQKSDTNDLVFISNNAIEIVNECNYKTLTQRSIMAGNILGIIGQNPEELAFIRQAIRDSSQMIVVDATILNPNSMPMNRAKLMANQELIRELQKLKWQKINGAMLYKLLR